MPPAHIHTSRARISEAQYLEILRLFALDLNASQIAKLLGVNRNTANRYVMAIRKEIARHSLHGFYLDSDHGPISVDRISGVRGRNPSARHVLIWLFEEESGVHTEMVPSRLTALMQAVMRGKVRADGVLEALGLESCKAIADLNSRRIFHLQPRDREEPGRRGTISTLDRFWGVLQLRMVKMRGIKRASLPYHLKECEFRFNNAQSDLFALLHSFCAAVGAKIDHASLETIN